MRELFDFMLPRGSRGAVIELQTEGKPWAYRDLCAPQGEKQYITYGQDFKMDHAYRIITVDGKEMAERIK